ncbi:TPA: hypothetical protein NRK63_000985 [Clostridioides difficile]|uniref:hypothetical protein n=1 Tax=Clostridioides difficile TaxID=1496 RepID=UPI00093A0732|nr:hypothetical protein [Clostridioides difficile]MDN9807200.1 hypothetical protein [Clostridioides difficile]SJP09413.1 Uncharacterised protein [Clostridioides difficile]SJT90286.1 Uncharacterised protein [Clostridioides difficile]SJU04112.1 Uncharacterised protein [Clostridioides difficile]SJU09267.1 Uncharacterised protein [Clostridioides difficile]
MYEQRKAKVIFNKGAGNSRGESYTNRVTIPTTWIKHMDITKLDREVLLTFDGNKIIIEKIDEFLI